LLKPEEFFKAIDKLTIDKSYAIVTFGLNLDYYINHIKVHELFENKYRNTDIHSFDGSQVVRESLFVLKKSDLPNITTKQIDEDTIAKYSLNKISDTINLYSSVIDMNIATKEIFNENKEHKSDDELKKSVLLSIIILTEFKWKKNIEVVELRQYSDYFQKGIANKLDEVKPMNNDKPSN
jgi:transcription elongation factor Elf1